MNEIEQIKSLDSLDSLEEDIKVKTFDTIFDVQYKNTLLYSNTLKIQALQNLKVIKDTL